MGIGGVVVGVGGGDGVEVGGEGRAFGRGVGDVLAGVDALCAVRGSEMDYACLYIIHTQHENEKSGSVRARRATYEKRAR